MFRTVVLPAPFGPMTDMIWPASTSRLTRVTAWTPPNDFDTSWISSCVVTSAVSELSGGESRQPPLAPPVVLDVAIALALADTRQSQVELLDVLVRAQPVGRTVEHDPAALHHIPVLHDRE